MADNIAFGLKVAFFLVAIYQLYNLKMGYIFLLAVPVFMTGVELITYSVTPWDYLLSSLATTQDYEKAFLGGIAMMMLPIFACGILFQMNKENAQKEQLRPRS